MVEGLSFYIYPVLVLLYMLCFLYAYRPIVYTRCPSECLYYVVHSVLSIGIVSFVV